MTVGHALDFRAKKKKEISWGDISVGQELCMVEMSQGHFVFFFPDHSIKILSSHESLWR